MLVDQLGAASTIRAVSCAQLSASSSRLARISGGVSMLSGARRRALRRCVEKSIASRCTERCAVALRRPARALPASSAGKGALAPPLAPPLAGCVHGGAMLTIGGQHEPWHPPKKVARWSRIREGYKTWRSRGWIVDGVIFRIAQRPRISSHLVRMAKRILANCSVGFFSVGHPPLPARFLLQRLQRYDLRRHRTMYRQPQMAKSYPQPHETADLGALRE